MRERGDCHETHEAHKIEFGNGSFHESLLAFSLIALIRFLACFVCFVVKKHFFLAALGVLGGSKTNLQ